MAFGIYIFIRCRQYNTAKIFLTGNVYVAGIRSTGKYL